MSLHFFDGIPVQVPNEICEQSSKHWYISFNPSARDYGCKTTALVLGDCEYFLVLNGDHRLGLKDAIEAKDGGLTTSLGRCLAYVRENKDKLNKYSDPLI